MIHNNKHIQTSSSCFSCWSESKIICEKIFFFFQVLWLFPVFVLRGLIPWKQAFESVCVCVFQRRGVPSVPCGSVQGAWESGLSERHKREHQRYGASSLTGITQTFTSCLRASWLHLTPSLIYRIKHFKPCWCRKTIKCWYMVSQSVFL